MVLLIQYQVENITDDYNGNDELLCICQDGDETVEMVSSTLLEVAALPKLQRCILKRKKLQSQENFCKHRLQIVNVKAMIILSDFVLHCLRMNTTVVWYDKHQRTDHCNRTSQLHYAPVYHISLLIQT